MKKFKTLKKISHLILLLTFIIFITACDRNLTSRETTDEVKVILDTWIPTEITLETKFPEIIGTRVDYFINGNLVTDLSSFERPLYDQDVILDVTVYGNNGTKTYTYETLLLSDYSPRHAYQIHLESFDMNTLSRTELQPNYVTLKQYQDILISSPIMLRGRGNSSFYTFEKKSLKIEFETSIEWMGLKGNSFNLIAMHSDKSFMRDALAHIASYLLDLDIKQSFRYVEVYNGNDYIGLYLLVEDRTFIKTDTLDETLDFAVEVDERIRWDGFIEPYIMVENRPHSIKRPFNPSIETSNRIQNYLQTTIDLLQIGNVPTYIDVENWMQFLYIHELFKNVDAWGLSIFLYQDSSEVLRMGPVWDFDLSVGNADYVGDFYYESRGFWLVNHPNATWFKDPMQLTAFNQAFKVVAQTFYVEHLALFNTIMQALAQSLIPYAQKNFYRYDILNTYIWPNPSFLYNITYQEQTQFVRQFLYDRILWLNEIVVTNNYQNKRY